MQLYASVVLIIGFMCGGSLFQTLAFLELEPDFLCSTQKDFTNPFKCLPRSKNGLQGFCGSDLEVKVDWDGKTSLNNWYVQLSLECKLTPYLTSCRHIKDPDGPDWNELFHWMDCFFALHSQIVRCLWEKTRLYRLGAPLANVSGGNELQQVSRTDYCSHVLFRDGLRRHSIDLLPLPDGCATEEVVSDYWNDIEPSRLPRTYLVLHLLLARIQGLDPFLCYICADPLCSCDNRHLFYP